MSTLAVIAPFGFSFAMPRFLGVYKSLGVTTAQFYRNELNPATAQEALEVAKAAGVRFDSIHGVFGYQYDPTSPDRGHREHCLRVYEREGRLARDLTGAGDAMVVVHPARWNTNRREMSRREARQAAAARRPLLEDWLRRLADVGARLGVVYLIENQPFNCAFGHDPVDLARLVAAVGSPGVRMCFDTGHAHITGDVCDALRQCAPVVSYLHVHDNDKVHDTHLMPGDGTIDWSSLADTLRKTGLAVPRMLEVFEPEARVEERAKAGFAAKLRQMCALD